LNLEQKNAILDFLNHVQTQIDFFKLADSDRQKGVKDELEKHFRNLHNERITNGSKMAVNHLIELYSSSLGFVLVKFHDLLKKFL
jgi:hypothetical protein